MNVGVNVCVNAGVGAGVDACAGAGVNAGRPHLRAGATDAASMVLEPRSAVASRSKAQKTSATACEFRSREFVLNIWWPCGRVGVWACGRVAVWRCGGVAVWRLVKK